MTEQPGNAPRKQMSADERRIRLHAAALRVMKRDGIPAATTRAICAEANMPHGAFHYCFHSKKELYAALLSSDIEIDLGAAWPAITAEATPKENISRLMIAFWSQIETDPQAQLVLFELSGYAMRDPELQELPRWELGISLDRATDYIKRLGEEAGLSFVQDERNVAELVLTVLNGASWSWLAHRDNGRARESLENFSSLIAGLARRATDKSGQQSTSS